MNIRELAKECNVHYNTMRRWLIENKVKKASKGKNASFVIDDDVIKKAKEYFLKDDEVKQQSYTSYTDDVKQQVSQEVTLVKQLEVKDKQIENQQKQIDHLQKLLENQQVLTLKANEKIELLENTQSKQNDVSTSESEVKKKSIFKRFFK